MSSGFLFDDMAEPKAQGAYGPREPGPPPHNGTPTSKAAAKSIAVHAGTLRAKVLDYLRSRPDGATADEIEAALGMPGNTVRPRLVELTIGGHARQTDLTRPTRQGRKAVVYEAVVHQEVPS